MRTWRAGLASIGIVIALATPAVAQGLQLEIARKATIVDGGSAAVPEVTATCPAGGQLLESFVYLNQDGLSTQWGSINVPCDGVPHSLIVHVTALDFVLHPGWASASGYLLLTTGECIAPAQSIKLKW